MDFRVGRPYSGGRCFPQELWPQAWLLAADFAGELRAEPVRRRVNRIPQVRNGARKNHKWSKIHRLADGIEGRDIPCQVVISVQSSRFSPENAFCGGSTHTKGKGAVHPG